MSIAIVNHWSAQGQHPTNDGALASMGDLLGCMERLRPMLHRKLVSLEVMDELDVRELLARQPLTQTVNSAKADFAKRWYFYTKSLRTPLGTWETPYRIQNEGGEVIDVRFGQAMADASFLLGFSDSGWFPPGLLKFDNLAGGSIERQNSTSRDELSAHLLCFEPHDQKHHPNSRGDVSPMDLTDATAQRVLDCSIEVDKWGRLGCHNGVFYEFFCTLGRIYHGWRMPEHERANLPSNLVELLLKIDASERPD